jgi:6-pyruvoyltetrahydropterin/6-carboxytetrahydropterin synthase
MLEDPRGGRGVEGVTAIELDMLRLSRTVRFSVNNTRESGPATNTFAAYPTMVGLGRHYEIAVVCEGDADPVTGYFVNIKEIDQAVRSAALPAIEHACRENPDSEAGVVLAGLMGGLSAALGGRVRSARWWLSPYYSVEVEMAALQKAVLRQQFEFAAAHRLHVPSLSDAENREVFGKCNNPTGHGHNYRVEPAVEVDLGAARPFTLVDLERATQDTIIRRLDHTHLNKDTIEFRDGSGLNPSVENIAKVCFELLAPAITARGARLRGVTVWETDKTSCTYPG